MSSTITALFDTRAEAEAAKARLQAEAGLGEAEAFREQAERAQAVLAARPGYLDGQLGRNADDPTLWVLMTRWEHVGAYRRALSSYDVKVGAVPLLSRAVNEPSAYLVLPPGGPADSERG